MIRVGKVNPISVDAFYNLDDRACENCGSVPEVVIVIDANDGEYTAFLCIECIDKEARKGFENL